MSTIAATNSGSALWFITRATGATSIVLLTIAVALGVANVRRVHTRRVPRFVLDAVHRNASLLAMTFLLAHIATSILDGYVPLHVLDAVVPFGGRYKPLWVGLGAVSFDLLIAVTLTSLIRRRLGYRAWRATHWLAYAAWPVGVVHGLGMGTDAATTWMLVLTGACVFAVLAAALIRATTPRAGGSVTVGTGSAPAGTGTVSAGRPPVRRPTTMATGSML